MIEASTAALTDELLKLLDASHAPLSTKALACLKAIIVDCNAISDHAKTVESRVPEGDPLRETLRALRNKVAWIRASGFSAESEIKITAGTCPDISGPADREPAEAHVWTVESRKRPQRDGKMAAANDHSLDDDEDRLPEPSTLPARNQATEA